jgi:hypothetical protein
VTHINKRPFLNLIFRVIKNDIMREKNCAQDLERIIGTEYAGGFISERY